MLYPPWRSSTTAILSQQKYVRVVKIKQRTHYMLFSFAKKLCVCGIQWSGSTKTWLGSLCLSATFSLGLCILRTTSDWNFSQSRHGCCGIGVTLSPLAAQFIHSPRFIVWLVSSSKNSLHFRPSP